MSSLPKYLQHLSLQEGETVRMNCPICGRRNTFTVSKSQGSVVWNCYSAHCEGRGATASGMSVKDVQEFWKGEKEDEKEFIPLSHWVSVTGRPRAVEYLHSFGLLPAVKDGRVVVRYDPKEDRLVFLIKDEENVTRDAIGRALSGKRNGAYVPKWRRYGRYAGGGIVKSAGMGDSIVVCEDIISATVLSSVFDACALLGTNLTARTLSQIISGGYTRAYIWLDPDATAKSLSLSSRVGLVLRRSSIILAKDDPKYYDAEEVKAFISAADA